MVNALYSEQISFSKDELAYLEKADSRLLIKAKYLSPPIKSIKVDTTDFLPDIRNYYMLPEYSYDYHLSFSHMVRNIAFSEVLRRDKKLNLFKISVHGDRAKKLGTQLIYTSTEYLGICENRQVIQDLKSSPVFIKTKDEFSFTTVGKTFYGILFSCW